MREDFLHYVWKYKKYDFGNARTVDGTPVTIISSGSHNHNSGPDFFNAKIKIGEQIWAGNVEIHIKSSDWYAHHHETDPNYDNVILHVVWEDDVAIFRKDNSSIPTMELQNLVPNDTLQNYGNLLLAPNDKWINCEADFGGFNDFDLNNWLERLYFERLQKKSETILNLLRSSENNWEEVLFRLLAKNFGLKVNGDAFLSLALSLDFKVIQKSKDTHFQLEALLLGQIGMLQGISEEVYFRQLKEEYYFLKTKFGIDNSYVERPKYFRLRPDNFPNIRLSQLASLYASTPHLFSQILKAQTKMELYKLFSVEVSKYWKTHYNFGKSHSFRNKKLSLAFIDLLIINTIVPIRFCYAKFTGVGEAMDVLSLINEIKSEKNSVIEKYNTLRPQTSLTAMHSQSLLHLKNEYCDKNACLQCALGEKLLRKKI